MKRKKSEQITERELGGKAQTVYLLQCQSLREDEHDKHSHKKFVLIIRPAYILYWAAHILIVDSHGRVSLTLRLGWKQRDLRCPISDGPNAVVSDNPNA